MFLALRLYRLLLVTVTFLLPFAAFDLGYRLWAILMSYLDRPILYPSTGHFNLILLCSFVWAFMAERYRVTRIDELFRERTGGKAATSAVVATGVVLLAVLFFSRDDVVPRGLFVCGIFVLFVLSLAVHAIFRAYIRKNREWGTPSRILVVGADAFAHEAAERLERLSCAPCRVTGYVCLPGQEPAATASPVYRFDEIGGLNATGRFNEAVIAIHPAQFAQIPQIVEAMEKLSLPARAIVDLGEGIVVRERLFQLGRMQMLDLTRTPADSLDYALLKRVFDVAFSLTVLVLTAPLLILITALVRLTSPGPIFFEQDRVGMNGETFKMYKFRTMRVSPVTESDTVWTTEQDSRRTPIGAFLRKTSLDELPQFYNVLKGNMSVVGPRPERPYFAQKFLQHVARYNNRHCLKVGITGWAQVNGWRGDTSIEKRIEHDLYYLQNWSMSLDLRIIAITVMSALMHRNAY